MLLRCFLLILLLIGTAATDCHGADQYECSTSLCSTFQWTNSSCNPITNGTCTIGQVYLSNTCVSCSSLSIGNCTSICPDYLPVSPGSGPSTCQSCQSIYGANCIRCTTSDCLTCSLTSGLVLAEDGKSCTSPNCTISQCLTCYDSGQKCYQCFTGYTTNSNFSACVSTNCTVPNCISCVGGVCENCFPDYYLSWDQSSCNPICNDPYCVNCIGPGVCSACVEAYNPINGTCTIDCTQIDVENCNSCIDFFTCKSCNPGYALVDSGTYCQAVCQVSNCYNCRHNPNTCVSCYSGYNLVNSTTCTLAFCFINNCATCLTLTTCQTCIQGFTLSSDETTCISNCPTQTPTSFANCLFCTNSTCTSCNTNYVVNSTTGQCQLLCFTISNCVSCETASICLGCANGWKVSSDASSCLQICWVAGCAACPSSTSHTCTTCSTGYSPLTVNGLTRCTLNCGVGQVNTGSTGHVICQSCSQAVSTGHCNTCTISSGNVVCTNCVNGYFINGQGCDKCSNAIANCITCSSVNTCTTCYPNLNLKLVNGQCIIGACNSGVTNCYACASSTPSKCHTCNPGYTLTSSKACQPITCPNTYVFSTLTSSCTCPVSTYESSGACFACTDENCYNCTSSACIQCNLGYYPDGLTCAQCQDNCQNCTSATTCVQCDFSYSLDANGDCVQFGQGDSCVTDPSGNVLQCDPGCQVCQVSTSGDGTICTVPQDGYSIVGGEIEKCDPVCRQCTSYMPSICSACYPQYALNEGTCSPCTDPNALTCAQNNVDYSLTCAQGYTATFASSVNSTGGVCNACAEDCNSCDNNGPGNCDPGNCVGGTVQLTGTLNCSMCFSGCTQCSPTNPNICLLCGNQRYLTSAGTCATCQTGCTACTTTAANCQSCDTGYSLIGTSCLAIPAKCVGLDVNGKCTACFKAYALNGNKICQTDLSCNSTQSCTICAESYYLSGVQCFTCQLPANCKTCNPLNSSICTSCNTGYYLDQNNLCQPCIQNCLACANSRFCTQVILGYYLMLTGSGAFTGAFDQCLSPCNTCTRHKQFCLTCVDGYELAGTDCRRSFFLRFTCVFGPGGLNSIFQEISDLNTQQFNAIKSMNRLGSGIFSICPKGFRSDNNWRNHLRFQGLFHGSIQTQMTLEGGTYTDGSTATTDMTNALANTPIDGVSYLSSTVVANGFSSSGSSSTNLGLVLGLSIPLSILLVLIIVIIAYYRRKNSQSDEGNQHGFYSEDKIEQDGQMGLG